MRELSLHSEKHLPSGLVQFVRKFCVSESVLYQIQEHFEWKYFGHG